MPVLLSCLLLGVVAGLRSMTAPAALAWALGAPAWLRWGLVLAALGEYVADQLPFTPARTKPGPFVGRVVSGAVCGWFLGGGLGACVGALGAVMGTLGGYQTRVRLGRLVGRDWPVAVGEDVLAVVLAVLAMQLRWPTFPSW